MNTRLAKILQEARLQNRKVIKVDNGTWFRVDYIPFLGWLQGTRLPLHMQRAIGSGKRPLPEEFVWAEYKMPNKPGRHSLQDLGAVGSAFEAPEVEEFPEPVRLRPLWNSLTEDAYQEGLKAGGDASSYFFDMYLPDNRDPDQFDSWLGNISWDVGQNFEYDLSPKLGRPYQEYLRVLDSGNYDSWGFPPPPTRKRVVKERLGQNYASGWLESTRRSWEKLERGELKPFLAVLAEDSKMSYQDAMRLRDLLRGNAALRDLAGSYPEQALEMFRSLA
jgi:hypothetical protein